MSPLASLFDAWVASVNPGAGAFGCASVFVVASLALVNAWDAGARRLSDLPDAESDDE